MKRLAPRNTAGRWRSLRHSETEPWGRSALRHARVSLPGPPLPGERWVTGVTVLAPPLTMPAPRPQGLEPSLSLSGLWLPSVREWTRHPWVPSAVAHYLPTCGSTIHQALGWQSWSLACRGPARRGRPRVKRGREHIRGSGASRCQSPPAITESTVKPAGGQKRGRGCG